MRNVEDLYDDTQIIEDIILFYFFTTGDPHSFDKVIKKESLITTMYEEK